MNTAYKEYETADWLYEATNSQRIYSSEKIELDGIECRSPLWRRFLAFIGFKRFARWEIRYRFIQRAHVDTELERKR